MADIPLVQEAPEQEKKGNEGFCIRIIRTLYDESCLFVTITSKIEPVPEVRGK